MSIIDFIEQDSKKIKNVKKWQLILVVTAIFISFLIGYGTRGDFIEAFELYNVIPSLALIFIFSVTNFFILKNKSTKLFFVTSFFFLVTSLLQIQTDVSLAKFENNGFWRENFHCLKLGLVNGIILSGLFFTILKIYFPILSSKKILIYSLLASMPIILTLSLHCPGPLRSHIIISHWGAMFFTYILLLLVLKISIKYK